MLQHTVRFRARPEISARHGNQQEVTEDRWMLTNFMTDGNHPSNSDFMAWVFSFLQLSIYQTLKGHKQVCGRSSFNQCGQSSTLIFMEIVVF